MNRNWSEVPQVNGNRFDSFEIKRSGLGSSLGSRTLDGRPQNMSTLSRHISSGHDVQSEFSFSECLTLFSLTHGSCASNGVALLWKFLFEVIHGNCLGFCDCQSKAYPQLIADRTGQYGRAYGTMFCPSVVCLSVTFCIVAKRYVVEGRRWYRWIGRW